MALGDYLKTERLIKLPWYQKALIIGVIVLVIVILYFFTLDRRYQNKIKDLKGQIAKLDKDITDLQTVKRDLPKFERQNALLKKQLEKAMTKLPSKAQIDALLKDVTVRARNNNVDITAFEKKPEIDQTLYVEVPVDIKMKSGFFQAMIFFNELARLERIVNVKNLTMKSDKIGNLEVSYTLNAYRFREASEATPETKKGQAKKGFGKPKEEE